MATNTLVAYFVVKGDNAKLERQYLKIVSDYSIAVDGRQATATITSTMYVHRDKYGPSTGKKSGDCYITIDGVKQNVIASGKRLPDLGNTYVQIGSAVTHTVTYDATTSKTVAIEAQFDTTDSNKKLNNYIIPVEDYTLGTGTVESGSASLTFSLQVVDPYVYIYGNDWERYVLHIYDGNGFSKYAPYIHDGTDWVRYS